MDDGILGEFQVEFLQYWRNLPNKAFFFVLLAGWLLLFQLLGNSTLGFIHSPSLLVWMFDVYRPTEMGDEAHGYIIPFAVIGILWWRRKELMALPLRSWWPGLTVFIFGLLLHLAGYRIQQPRISIAGLFVGIYGLTGMAWGPEWLRRTFFPFVLFVFSIPLGTLAQPITFKLRLLVSQIVEGISHTLAIEVIRDGTTLRDPTGHYGYEIAAACSGIRSSVSTLLMATIYAMVGFKVWWKRGVLIASAIPLAVAGNVLRLLAIVTTSEWIDPSWGHAIHDGGPMGILSLLPYVPPFFGLIYLGQWLEGRSKPGNPTPPSRTLKTSAAQTSA